MKKVREETYLEAINLRYIPKDDPNSNWGRDIPCDGDALALISIGVKWIHTTLKDE